MNFSSVRSALARSRCSQRFICSRFRRSRHRPALLFTYLFVIDLGLLALTLIENRLVAVQAVAGLAAFIFLGAWTGNYLTTGRLYTALAFYFVFTLFHTAAPIALATPAQNRHAWWSHAFPAFGLVLVLIPMFQLTERSAADLAVRVHRRSGRNRSRPDDCDAAACHRLCSCSPWSQWWRGSGESRASSPVCQPRFVILAGFAMFFFVAIELLAV